jgi:hypothetical protein
MTNLMTPADLFTRCGKALCGDGIRWKEQFAAALGIRTDTVDAMSKGDTRIPPGVWKDLRETMRLRALAFADLGQEGESALACGGDLGILTGAPRAGDRTSKCRDRDRLSLDVPEQCCGLCLPTLVERDRHDVHQHRLLNRRGATSARRWSDARGLSPARPWPPNEGRKGRKGRKPRISPK